MRSLTLILTFFSLGLLGQSVHAQRVAPQKDDAFDERKVVELDQDTVREIQAIERDLERVPDRMSKLEAKHGEFALERVMISKAFDQIVRKLYVFPRPKTDEATAERNDQKTRSAASDSDHSKNEQRNGNDAGKTVDLDRRE